MGRESDQESRAIMAENGHSCIGIPKKKPLVEIYIDDKLIEYDGYLPDPIIKNNAVGGYAGMDSNTKPEDEIVSWTCNRLIWSLAIYRNMPNGGWWAINGLFKRGEWDEGENGEAIYKVWDRIV